MAGRGGRGGRDTFVKRSRFMNEFITAADAAGWSILFENKREVEFGRGGPFAGAFKVKVENISSADQLRDAYIEHGRSHGVIRPENSLAR